MWNLCAMHVPNAASRRPLSEEKAGIAALSILLIITASWAACTYLDFKFEVCRGMRVVICMVTVADNGPFVAGVSATPDRILMGVGSLHGELQVPFQKP